MKVLVINAGSSSLKYQLMDTDTRTVLAKGVSAFLPTTFLYVYNLLIIQSV